MQSPPSPTRSCSRGLPRGPDALSQFSAAIHASTAEIAEPVWNALVPSTGGRPDNPFLDHRFLLALEQAGCAVPETGWHPRHVVIARDGVPLGLLPLYAKTHSMGEYVFDHAWADAFARAGGRYYPKLQGSIPFTPVTAPKLLVPSADPAIATALLGTAMTLAEHMDASSVHLTFVPESEEALAMDEGWLARHDTQFHWRNPGYASFDDFLGDLSSSRRKTIRRERREALSGGLQVEWLTGADIAERHWDAFYDFYGDTGARKWGRPYLNRTFFSLLGEAMADRVVLMLAREGDDYIGGALNLLGRDTLYGRYWGALVEKPFLHFEVCYYQAIDFAIAHKLAVVEAGAQGEHKLARGYAPVTTRSVHWIAHDGLRQAVADHLDHEKAAVAQEQVILDRYTPFRRRDDLD